MRRPMPPTPRILVLRRQVERLHGQGNVGAKPKGEVVAYILSAIKERRA
jgi:hypothetical protein